MLTWFTSLDAAITEARRTNNKAILSLRLLGKLPDELTCANSRFFKRVLYSEPRIRQVLAQDFVLHWESVRPVPIVTLDFGDGRRVTKTVTGNSGHLVLDAYGRVVDALPGLFAPDAFLALLAQARTFAHADRRVLPQLHANAARQPTRMPSSPSRAMAASAIAMTKHLVELPVLRQIEPLPPIAIETERNHELHRRIHEAFAQGAEWAGVAGFVEWMYAELFAMPLHDAALGLDAPEPFTDVGHPPFVYASASSHAETSPRRTTPPRSNSATSAMPAARAMATSR